MLKGELHLYHLFPLEIRISARNSWLLNPSILTPIELIRLSTPLLRAPEYDRPGARADDRSCFRSTPTCEGEAPAK